VSNSIFQGNSAPDTIQGRGGAIFAFQFTGNFTNTTFQGNSATKSGAVLVGGGSSVRFDQVGG